MLERRKCFHTPQGVGALSTGKFLTVALAYIAFPYPSGHWTPSGRWTAVDMKVTIDTKNYTDSFPYPSERWTSVDEQYKVMTLGRLIGFHTPKGVGPLSTVQQ